MAVIKRKKSSLLKKKDFNVGWVERRETQQIRRFNWTSFRATQTSQNGKLEPEPYNQEKLPCFGALQSITAAALVLPGLLAAPAQAADDDEVDFQYSHYQEGERELFGNVSAFSPIEVESLHGSAKVKLTDRIKFAFNYTQDTWGGATPIATAPEAFGGNSGYKGVGAISENVIKSGATPYAKDFNINYFNNKLQPGTIDPVSGKFLQNGQLVHTLAQASAETRKQGDFKLSYDWDEAGIELGGGISVENDYESRFGNVNGRMDFNNKQTTVNLGLSYTNSDTNATLDHDLIPYLYDVSNLPTVLEKFYNDYHSNSRIINPDPLSAVDQVRIVGKREDWGVQLGLTQVLNKNALMQAGFGYTRSTGYLDNPYKLVTIAFIDPLLQDPSLTCPGASVGLQCFIRESILENRPDERNQWMGSLGVVQHIEPLDSALHLNYHIFNDDWGITSHTFEADWVQPLGAGWTVTPRIRYYSQDQADFYTPYLVTNQGIYPNALDPKGREIFYDGNTGDESVEFFTDKNTGNWFDAQGNNVTEAVNNGEIFPTNKLTTLDRKKLPSHFSSDHRLSGYGALSGGITVSKQFARGVSLDLGFEYYTHKGSLKIGGGGEGEYADFDYWLANAALKVNLAALSFNGGDGGHSHHEHGIHAPAGVMFDHMLPSAGDMMVGYRYMYGSQGGTMLNGTRPVGDAEIIAQGCAPEGLCYLSPDEMSMHMHMVELMYAPTDWMTLMLMPQFMDMDMAMRKPENAPFEFTPGTPNGIANHVDHHALNSHETGGIGDLGMYAMFKLFDNGIQHLHVTTGFSAPTGDVDIQLRRTHTIDGGFIHYGMQLGSGTWDFKPSVTYTGHIDDWSWGAQANGTVRMEDRNKSGYALGDLFQATAWGSYDIYHWLTASVRGVYTVQGSVNGQFTGSANGQFIDPLTLDEFGQPKLSSILKFGPMDYPGNYGGRFWDVGFGLSAVIPSGALAGNKVSVEWLQPVEDDVNRYQLERDGSLSATWSMAF